MSRNFENPSNYTSFFLLYPHLKTINVYFSSVAAVRIDKGKIMPINLTL